MITVDKNKCPQDHRCPAMAVCPVGAISQKDFELPVIDSSLCIECKQCIDFCPKGAIYEI